MHKNEITIFKAISGFLIILAALIGYAQADVFIKQQEQKEAVYHHGNVDPATMTTFEIWIGDGKLSYKRKNIELLVDQEKGKACLVNHDTKTYAETSLPVHLDNIADEEYAPRLEMFRTQGELKTLDKKKKIGDRTCKLVEVTTWILYEENRFNETVTEACLTTDLPFDLKKAQKMLKEIQGLNNFDEGFYKEVVALEGFLIEAVSTQYMEGTHIPSKLETLEMSIKEAPQGTYTIPENFTKKERLTRAEILGR